MIWDGHCGFCRYWILYWSKLSGDRIEFLPFQERGDRFADVDELLFKQAARFIEEDGRIYSGPDAAYRSLYYLGRWPFLHRAYQQGGLFRKVSDHLYQFIADHRSFFFKLSKMLFGSNPKNLRPFWAIYLFLLLFIFLI